MIGKMIQIITRANLIFEVGKKIARAVLEACIVGALATGALIAKLISEGAVEAGEEPP